LAKWTLTFERSIRFKALTEKHQHAVQLLSELKKTKEKIDVKSGKVKPDVLYSLLQVRCDPLFLASFEKNGACTKCPKKIMSEIKMSEIPTFKTPKCPNNFGLNGFEYFARASKKYMFTVEQ
jgi:hypothetical protein